MASGRLSTPANIMKNKATERRRYLVRMWDYDSYAILDTHRKTIIGWYSSVIRAAKRINELNETYQAL